MKSVTIRLTDKEKKVLDQAAIEDDRTLTGFIRRSLGLGALLPVEDVNDE